MVTPFDQTLPGQTAAGGGMPPDSCRLFFLFFSFQRESIMKFSSPASLFQRKQAVKFSLLTFLFRRNKLWSFLAYFFYRRSNSWSFLCLLSFSKESKLVLIAVRVHPFPSRTRQLSSSAPKILGWRRPGKIGSANTKRSGQWKAVCFFFVVGNVIAIWDLSQNKMKLILCGNWARLKELRWKAKKNTLSLYCPGKFDMPALRRAIWQTSGRKTLM